MFGSDKVPGGSSNSKLVVYHLPNLNVLYHYANLVRLCLGSVAIRRAKKKPSGVIRSQAHDIACCSNATSAFDKLNSQLLRQALL
jgi:hypothetical protein